MGWAVLSGYISLQVNKESGDFSIVDRLTLSGSLFWTDVGNVVFSR